MTLQINRQLTPQEKLDLIKLTLDKISTHINQEIKRYEYEKRFLNRYLSGRERDYIQELRRIKEDLGHINSIAYQTKRPTKAIKFNSKGTDSAGIPLILPTDHLD